MINALKKTKFTQTLAKGTVTIGLLAGSMLVTSSANAVQLTWAQWSGGTVLTEGDKTATYMSKTPNFLPEADDTVTLMKIMDEYVFKIDFGGGHPTTMVG